MSDMNGGYTLNRRGLAIVERAAMEWSKENKSVFSSCETHEEIDAAYEAASESRKSMMPEFLETDEDFKTYQTECDARFDLEAISDAAHEAKDQNYFD